MINFALDLTFGLGGFHAIWTADSYLKYAFSPGGVQWSPPVSPVGQSVRDWHPSLSVGTDRVFLVYVHYGETADENRVLLQVGG